MMCNAYRKNETFGKSNVQGFSRMLKAPHNEKILIAEDEQNIVLELASILWDLGYNVLDITSSVEDTLQSIDEEPPDLILMDIKFKGDMDSISVQESVKSRFQIPIIYVSAYSTEEISGRVRRTSPFGYIDESTRQIDLETAIESLLCIK